MKRSILVGFLIAAIGAAYVHAQAPAAAKPAPKPAGTATEGQGHTAPKTQPETAPAPTAPAGAIALGSVHLPRGVKADGQTLAAGTYQVRLTADVPSQPAPGQSQGLERWVEFVQGGKVKGREVVSIVPQSEIAQVQKDAPPKANSSKVETLKGGDYLRLWINRGGNHYLVHFPAA